MNCRERVRLVLSASSVAAVLLLTALKAPSWAFIGSLEILPPEPSSDDEITVRLSGDLPNPCWSVLDEEVRLSGDQIQVEVHMTARPGVCVQIIVPDSAAVSLGRLAAGSYHLTVADAQTDMSLDFKVVSSLPEGGEAKFVRGDANEDHRVDISDAIRILQLLFLGQGCSSCLDALDSNDDGKVDISDPTLLLNYLFRGEPPPDFPFGACGPDPSEDQLTCSSFAGC